MIGCSEMCYCFRKRKNNWNCIWNSKLVNMSADLVLKRNIYLHKHLVNLYGGTFWLVRSTGAFTSKQRVKVHRHLFCPGPVLIVSVQENTWAFLKYLANLFGSRMGIGGIIQSQCSNLIEQHWGLLHVIATECKRIQRCVKHSGGELI